MAGRPQQYDEQKALDKATELFWTRGYEATSLDDLLTEMGMGKSSFYHAFTGKKELFGKIMDRYTNEAIFQLRKDLETSPRPLECIREFFRSIASAPAPMHQKGCFMGNALVELSHQDKQLRNRAAKRLETLEQLFLHYLQIARQSGELKSREDLHTLARYLMTTWNGLNITRRIYPDPKALRSLIELQLSIVQ